MQEIASRRNSQMQADSLPPDVCLCTEDGATFEVHKLQLSLNNGYFKSLFHNYCSEKDEILMRGINGKTMGIIIKYLYTGCVSLDRNNVWDVWIASDYILADTLKEQCRPLVMKEINEENCLAVYLAAWSIEGPEILDNFLRYVIVYFRNIIFTKKKTVNQRNKNFLKELPFEALKKILGNRSLNTCDEKVVLDVMKAWFSSNKRKRLKYIPKLLECFYVEDKDTQLVTHIQTSLKVKRNPFCNSPTKLSPYAEGFELKSQPYSAGPRTPPNLHFAARYCRARNRSCLDLYLTYDNKLDFWRKLTRVPQLRPGLVFQVGHLIYMLSRDNNMTFNILDGSRTPIAAVEFSHRGYSGVLLEDRIYIMGIRQWFYDMIECYDPTINSWYPIPMMNPMATYEIVAMNGCIYAIGDNFRDPPMTVQIYNPTSSSWSAVNVPRQFVWGCTSVVYRGRMYVIGEEVYDEENTNERQQGMDEAPFRTVEYDPGTDSWEYLPVFPITYTRPKAITFNDRLIVYERPLERDGIESKAPPVVWDAHKSNWVTISESSLMYTVDLYKFCTISQPQIVRDLTEANRTRPHIWIKSHHT